jgi:hypothetical protein
MPEPIEPARVGPATRVDGRAMLLVSVLLLSAIVTLILLAGRFGREPTIREQPRVHWTRTPGS